MTIKCICNICTCGRHYCKHHSTNFIGTSDVTSKETEYNSRYTEHGLDRVEPFRPIYKPIPPERMDHRTIHRDEFRPHLIEKRSVPPQMTWTKPSGSMDNLTFYSTNFTGRQVPRVKPFRHEKVHVEPVRFDAEPTYTIDYPKWDFIPRKKYGPISSWKPPTQKLLSESMFARDYKYNYEPPRKSMRPEQTSLTEGTMDNTTGYKEQFIQYPLPAKILREKQQYNLPTVPIDGTTTSKSDYRGEAGPMSESCRPKLTPLCSTQPFPIMTTFRSDFPGWPTEKRQVQQPQKYEKPAGNVETQTVNQLTYKEFPIQKVECYKPPTSQKPTGIMEGDTMYSLNFKKYDAPVIRTSRRNTYTVSDVPFTEISTQQAHFVEQPMSKSISYKPKTCLKPDKTPIVDATSYRDDYMAKEIPVCPILFLDTDKSPYKFEGNSKNGHQLYKDTNEEDTLETN